MRHFLLACLVFWTITSLASSASDEITETTDDCGCSNKPGISGNDNFCMLKQANKKWLHCNAKGCKVCKDENGKGKCKNHEGGDIGKKTETCACSKWKCAAKNIMREGNLKWTACHEGNICWECPGAFDANECFTFGPTPEQWKHRRCNPSEPST